MDRTADRQTGGGDDEKSKGNRPELQECAGVHISENDYTIATRARFGKQNDGSGLLVSISLFLPGASPGFVSLPSADKVDVMRHLFVPRKRHENASFAAAPADRLCHQLRWA
jgi:hypothetical protein